MKHPLGIPRLDELLGGGADDNAALLVHGPPFSGKQLMADLFILEGLRRAVPAIIITVTATVQETRRRLHHIEPRYVEFERLGLVRFVDAYTRALGLDEEPLPHAHYVDGLMNLSDLAGAFNEAQHELSEHQHQRYTLSSASSIAAQASSQATFRFLQTLIARGRRSGACGLTILEHGMHAPSDVEAYKSLHTGCIDMRRDGERLLLHVQGARVYANPGWVEYRHDDRRMEVVGSLAGGRVR